MKTKVVTGILVLAVVAAAIGVVAARNNFGMQPPAMDHQWSSGSRWINQLTEEQRQEVIQQMQEFKQQTCDQYNITRPSGTKFVDEDGAGIHDNKGPHRGDIGVDMDLDG